jgi:signal transduction histidine kinase
VDTGWHEQQEAECRDTGGAAMVVATVAIGALTGLTLWALSRDDSGALLVLDVVVALVSCALVPVALRWPVAGGLALSALAVLSGAATPAASFAVLQVARRRPFPVALGVGVCGVTAQAVQGWWRPQQGLAYLWWLLLITAAYAALVGWGALAQARAALLSSLRERAARAEADQERRVREARFSERTRIAREMHDVLAHRLSLVATYAGALEYRPDAAPEKIAAAAGVVRDGVHQALEELREVVSVLRDGDGTDERPAPRLADVDGLVAESRDAGLTVRLDNRIAGSGEPSAAVGRTAYRVVQEALTNARKHAVGEPVVVTLDGGPGERLVIDVRNRVSAHRSPALLPGAGTGLIGLAERVQLSGGRLDHDDSTAGEFHLHAWLPWR